MQSLTVRGVPPHDSTVQLIVDSGFHEFTLDVSGVMHNSRILDLETNYRGFLSIFSLF